MFPFRRNIIFSELSFKRKCKKVASSHKCVFLRKYENFVVNMKCCILTKSSNFLLVFRSSFWLTYLSEKMTFSVVLQQKQAICQLFVEDVYIFPIISFRKRDRRIADFFFSFMIMKACSLNS